MEKLIEAIKQGRIFLVGECRGARPEVIRYVDKKTGQAVAFTVIVYLVERPGVMESVLITRQVSNTETDPNTIKIGVQKGKTYAFELSGFERIRGVVKARMAAEAEPLPL
ncbi:hypothetical protein DB345_19840 [Spartobacteria bacterium LR76]|nr:hypothetical protein DB345_19840 [Spartobacteria bacterium LR76]